MKGKLKLLAIVGSHRRDGNSYLLAKTVLDSVNVAREIIQLADKEIEYCNLCGECVNGDCVVEDDFNSILEEMKRADGMVFSVPRYAFVASKFLSFLERLATVNHMRMHMGYERKFKDPDYRVFQGDKPACLFVLSGTGRVGKETFRIVADYIESPGLKLVRNDQPPYVGANVKAGDRKGEVLENEEAVDECRRLVEKLIFATK
jgi:multimeric flavodoxin WrbA